MRSVEIRIKGIVQGVGFRPFVFRTAQSLGISGSVLNDTGGVFIRAEGDPVRIESFIRCLKENHPPLAHIYSLEVSDSVFTGDGFFSIAASRESADRSAFYSPDAAVCPDCLTELFDPADRRYLYPFISCVNCGPRFSIVNSTPYDRANTAMSGFVMCSACADEYSDPHDRRFHSQPNACPACGPRVSLYSADGTLLTDDYIETAERAAALLAGGSIIAVKGIGGYHLACDALNESAVKKLRERKKRPAKPFALMASSADSVKKYYSLSAAAEELLVSHERPILLLDAASGTAAASAAPGLSNHGVMLPASPLHYAVFNFFKGDFLVMTSGNLADEPIVYEDSEAFRLFSGIADYIIAYDREITSQSDDSILFPMRDRFFFIRRSRGYIPVPFSSDYTHSKIFAAGADLKTSFAVARSDFILSGQYIGDMSDPATVEVYKSSAVKFMRLFDCVPDIAVCDAHPEYFTSAFCKENFGRTAEIIMVQHHHAHIASVLEDNSRSDMVIGLAFDGTGYGADGNLWGGELLLADKLNFKRAAHFSYFNLPGGESAIRDVWKTGLSLLLQAGISNHRIFSSFEGSSVVVKALEMNINSPLTCSIGRLFDGASAVIGIADRAGYEAEAAILLEEAAGRSVQCYESLPVLITEQDDCLQIDSADIILRVVESMKSNPSKEDAALLFHRLVITASVTAAEMVRKKSGINTAAMSGGAFQNRILLDGIWRGLESAGFEVLLPRRVPFNDGCIATGQIAAAKALLKKRMK